MSCDLSCSVYVTHPTDGRTDITGRVTGVTIDRGADRRSGRTKAGVCTISSTTVDPWVGPWRSAGVWYEGDLVGASVQVVIRVDGAGSHTVYLGVVDEVVHEASEQLSKVSLRCVDLWGEQIARAYVDVPVQSAPKVSSARFRDLMSAAGFAASDYTIGAAGSRQIAAHAAAPKQRLVQALQEVVDSENGYMFVNRFGVLTFMGHPMAAQSADVVVSDTDVSGAATPLRSPEVVLDRERLSNAVIVIAADATSDTPAYDDSWGTAAAGAASDASYTTPWDAASGSGTGSSGATEVVRSDAVSIAAYGRYERRQQTKLSPTDSAGLAAELLRERASLRPVVPNVEVEVEAEAADVANKLLPLDLDANLQIQVHSRTQPFLYADVAPIERINLSIHTLDMSLNTVGVTARYTLYRGVAPSWWTVGTSSLGSATVVGASGLTATSGQWIDGEIVDVDGINRIAGQAVARYATLSAESQSEGFVPPGVGYRYSIVASESEFRQYDAAAGTWLTIGTFS